MNIDLSPPQESISDYRRRFTISLPIAVGSFFVVLSSWGLFLVFAWQWIVILVFFLALITLAIAVVVRLLKWMKFRPWSIETGRRGLAAYVAVVLTGVTAAPIYGYIYGALVARSFVDQLSLDVMVVSQEILLVVPLSYGNYDPDRGVTTFYAVIEPIDGVISKLKDRIQDEDDWKISNGESFRAECWNYEDSGSTELELKYDGGLQVTIEYGTPATCLLR